MNSARSINIEDIHIRKFELPSQVLNSFDPFQLPQIKREPQIRPQTTALKCNTTKSLDSEIADIVLRNRVPVGLTNIFSIEELDQNLADDMTALYDQLEHINL